MIKKYLKSYLYLFGLILLLTLIISIISYLTNKNMTIIKIIIPVISTFISCIILGKNTKEKAYLESIKFSSIYVILTIILKFILKTPWSYKTIIIYFLLICSGIIGSMIGINIKKR